MMRGGGKYSVDAMLGKETCDDGRRNAGLREQHVGIGGAEVDRQVSITLRGADKALLGQTAAKLRALRKPDPYKGKGIKYADEYIRRKVGKKAGAK